MFSGCSFVCAYVSSLRSSVQSEVFSNRLPSTSVFFVFGEAVIAK